MQSHPTNRNRFLVVQEGKDVGFTPHLLLGATLQITATGSQHCTFCGKVLARKRTSQALFAHTHTEVKKTFPLCTHSSFQWILEVERRCQQFQWDKHEQMSDSLCAAQSGLCWPPPDGLVILQCFKTSTNLSECWCFKPAQRPTFTRKIGIILNLHSPLFRTKGKVVPFTSTVFHLLKQSTKSTRLCKVKQAKAIW